MHQIDAIQPSPSICGAKTRSGKPCQTPPVRGRQRCRMHGGTQPRGVDHPQHKDSLRGRLPERLAEKYLLAENDPDLLNLNHEIRITDIFLREALESLDDGPPHDLWKQISKEWAAMKAANNRRDAASARKHLDTLDALIERGYRASDARTEALGIMDQRRKLVESQSKREIALEQSVPVPQVMLLFSAFSQVTMKYVDTPAKRSALATELAQLVSGSGANGD